MLSSLLCLQVSNETLSLWVSVFDDPINWKYFQHSQCDESLGLINLSNSTALAGAKDTTSRKMVWNEEFIPDLLFKWESLFISLGISHSSIACAFHAFSLQLFTQDFYHFSCNTPNCHCIHLDQHWFVWRQHLKVYIARQGLNLLGPF